MTPIHARVACLDRVRDNRSFVVASEHVVALAQRYYLLEAECVFDDYNMAEILSLYIIVIFSDTYRETFTAMFALENKRLPGFVA